MPEALVLREIVKNKKDEYLQEANKIDKRVGEDATKRFVFTGKDQEKEPNIKSAKQLEATGNIREYGGSIRKIVESYPQEQNLLHRDELEVTEERRDQVQVIIEDLQAQIEEIKKKLTMSSAIVLGAVINHAIYIYNSEARNWQKCNFCFPFNVLLQRTGAVILKEELYVLGYIDINQNTCINSCKLKGDRWFKLSDMNEERRFTDKSTIVFNEEIWAIGGWNQQTKRTLKSVEKYNPETDSWTLMAELNHARSKCAAVVIDKKIFVCGGQNEEEKSYSKSVEVYDPDENKWEIFCDLPFELRYHSALVDGTNLIIIGGEKSDGEISKEVFKMDISNPTNNWENLPDLIKGYKYPYGAVKTEEGLMVFNEGFTEIFDGKEWRKRRIFIPIFASLTIQLSKKDEELFLRKYCS